MPRRSRWPRPARPPADGAPAGHRAAAVDRRRRGAGRRALPEPADRPRRADRRRPGADRRRAQRLGDRRRTPTERGPAGAERRERAERRHRHAGRDVLHRVRGDGPRHRRPPRRGRVRRARSNWRSASASVPASPWSAVACSPSPTATVGWSTARDAWRRWRWPCWRSWSRPRSVATRSCRPSSAASIFGATAGRDNAESVELAELGGSLLSLVLWFVFGAGFVIPAVRGPRCPGRHLRRVQPDGGAHGPGGDRAPRRRPGPGDRRCSSAGSARGGWRRWCSPCSPSRTSATATRGSCAAVHAIAITIVFSIVAHGLTARPLAGRYLAAIEARRRTAAPSMPPGAR